MARAFRSVSTLWACDGVDAKVDAVLGDLCRAVVDLAPVQGRIRCRPRWQETVLTMSAYSLAVTYAMLASSGRPCKDCFAHMIILASST